MADPQGISVAFNDPTLAPNPTWVRLDAGVTHVASYTIDRGRSYELDRTDGGRATVSISDLNGTLDPTNSFGTFYGKIEPLLQAAIARYDPVAATWRTRFRGFISDYDYDYDQTERVNRLTLSLVDMFEIVNSVEMVSGSTGGTAYFGDIPPVGSEGKVFFDNANVDGRIIQVLDNSLGTTAAAAFSVVFSGNVGLYETTYSSGESAMTAVQEAADSEFAGGVSNVYVDRLGRLVFHGRLAKFDPAATAASAGTSNWDFHHWHAGDKLAVGSSAGVAVMSEFAFNRGLSKIINQAYATPPENLFPRGTLDAQLVQDTVSIGLYGIRSWSAQNLQTKTGLLDSSDALTATKQFSTFYVGNYASPRNRVTAMAFRPVLPTATNAGTQWSLFTKIDIADQIDITVRGSGGSVAGFNQEPYFVEGIHEEVVGRLGTGSTVFDDVTLRLDVSPQAYFTSNPFPT